MSIRRYNPGFFYAFRIEKIRPEQQRGAAQPNSMRIWLTLRGIQNFACTKAHARNSAGKIRDYLAKPTKSLSDFVAQPLRGKFYFSYLANFTGRAGKIWDKNIIGFASFVLCIVIFGLYLPAQYVVPVIMYHKIDDNSAASKLSVSPENFERHMKFLKERRYNVVPVAEVARMFRQKSRIPPKTIAITFDDGYENNYTYAYPILKELDLPATMFVVTDWVGKEGYMSWEELKEIAENSKVTIGSHTVTHPHLPSLLDGEIGGELLTSKNLLEERLGRRVGMLSYPGGGFDKKTVARAMVHNYDGAVATNPGRQYRNDDPYIIKRIRISRTSDNLFVFWLETSGWYTWIKEHRDED